MKKLLVILFSSLISLNSIAAGVEGEFVAFSVKGKVLYKEKKADKEWKEVAVKTQFLKENIIKLEKDAELVLVHKLHTSVKLAKPGEHKVDVLSKEPGKNPNNENRAFWGYIWEEFNKQYQDVEGYRADYLQRKNPSYVKEDCREPIVLTPAYNEKLYADSITFTWKKDISGAGCTVVFTKEEGIKLLELQVTGETLTISANTLWFQPGTKFNWTAYTEGKPGCLKFPFSIVKKDDAQAFIKKIDSAFNASVQTPVDAAIAAYQLEEEGYMQEAGTYFYQAVVLSELATEYKLLYGTWLARAGRLEEAAKWW